jgi:hypothetical protein
LRERTVAEYIPVGVENIPVGAEYIQPLQRPLQRTFQHVIPNSIPSIVRSFKAAVTRECRKKNYPDLCWQRNYYEHIIRDENDLNNTREYILNNPLKWSFEKKSERISCRQIIISINGDRKEVVKIFPNDFTPQWSL